MNLYIFLQQSNFGSLILLLMIPIFYFFFIRPQAKKQKEQVAFSTNLKKGDEVVTHSGIIGQVNKIDDVSVTLELDTKTFIRVVRDGISKEMTDQYHKKSKEA